MASMRSSSAGSTAVRCAVGAWNFTVASADAEAGADGADAATSAANAGSAERAGQQQRRGSSRRASAIELPHQRQHGMSLRTSGVSSPICLKRMTPCLSIRKVSGTAYTPKSMPTRPLLVDQRGDVRVAAFREPCLGRLALVLVVRGRRWAPPSVFANSTRVGVLLAAGLAPRRPHVEHPHLAQHVGAADGLPRACRAAPARIPARPCRSAATAPRAGRGTGP